MPGALIHILIGLISALIVHRLHQRLEFSLSIFLGNLLPDVLKISFLAMYHSSLNLPFLIESNFHYFSHYLVNGFNFTIMFFLFWVLIGLLLYHYHFIKQKKLKEWEELVIFLFIGYVTHIILDASENFIYSYFPLIPIWI